MRKVYFALAATLLVGALPLSLQAQQSATHQSPLLHKQAPYGFPFNNPQPNDTLLVGVDQKEIWPVGILLDRAEPWAGLAGFSQNGQPDTSSADHFAQASEDLHRAAYDSLLALPAAAVRGIAARRQAALGSHLIPMGVLVYDAAHLDTLSEQDGLLSFDRQTGQFADIPGRPRSPFVVERFAVAAPLPGGAVLVGENYEFELTESLSGGHLTSTNVLVTGAPTTHQSANPIRNVLVNFDDGQPAVLLTRGDTHRVTYTTPGRHYLQYRVTLQDNSRLDVIAWLDVVWQVQARTTAEISPCRVDYGLRASIPFRNVTGAGDVYYWFGANKPCATATAVTKPVIIIDGIDFHNDHDGVDRYNVDFKYTENGQEQKLGERLRQAGYDVLFLDNARNPDLDIVHRFFNPHTLRYETYTEPDPSAGADYIERAALVLAELIKRTNASLIAQGSHEEIVLIGPSMGGIIARYALRYMEQHPADFGPLVQGPNGSVHNVRLFASFDAPHLGANIAIGDQHFIDYYASEGQEAAMKNRHNLDTPASRELLIDHFSDGSDDPVGHALHTPFYQDLNAMGWPHGTTRQPLRNVAVANGSLSGIQQPGAGDGDEAFSLNIYGRVRVHIRRWTLFSKRVKIGESRTYFAPTGGSSNTSFKWYLLGNWHERNHTNGFANSCGLDRAPGGRYPTQLYMDTDIGRWFVEAHSSYPDDSHCFISTASALAYSAPQPNLCESLAGRDLVCGQQTPFDAYYGPTGANEYHVTLNPANVAFFEAEIYRYSSTGTALRKLVAPRLTGVPIALCDGTRTVTAQNCHATSFLWTASTNLIINGQSAPAGTNAATFSVSTPTPTITLGISTSHPNYGGGLLSVIARRAQFADSDPAVAAGFRVGQGLLLIDNNSNGQPLCTGDNVQFSIRANMGIGSPYLWKVNGQPWHTSTNRIFNYTIPAGSATQYTITGQGVEACSGDPMAESIQFSVQRTNCPHRPAPRFAVYPNPVTTAELTMEAPDDDRLPFTATLHDGFGQLRRETAAPAGRAALPTTGLPPGLYYLTIRTAAGEPDRRTIEVR